MAVEGEDLAPTTLDPAWFQERIDRWRLGLLELADVEELATVALTRTFDGPALRELAWRQDGWVDVEPLLVQAVGELGLAVPTRAEAFRRLAGAIAREVALGEVPLAEGARRLDRLVAPFCYALEEDVFPSGFDPWELEYLVECLDEGWEQPGLDGLERRLAAVFAALTPGATPAAALVGPDDLAPALGGASAPAEPPPAAPPSSARFAWSFQLDIVLERFFRWTGPGGDRGS